MIKLHTATPAKVSLVFVTLTIAVHMFKKTTLQLFPPLTLIVEHIQQKFKLRTLGGSILSRIKLCDFAD